MPTTKTDVTNTINSELPDNLVKAIRPLNIRNVYNKIVDWVDTITSDFQDLYGNVATQSLTDGATITFNVANGSTGIVTLGGNRTLAFSNLATGRFYTLIVKQDGTGSRTLALPAGTKVYSNGGGTISLTAVANAIDILSFFYDGTNLYLTAGKRFS